MIKVNFVIGFQAKAITIATEMASSGQAIRLRKAEVDPSLLLRSKWEGSTSAFRNRIACPAISYPESSGFLAAGQRREDIGDIEKTQFF